MLRNITASVMYGCTTAAILIIALHLHPITVPPPDKGHPTHCDLERCW